MAPTDTSAGPVSARVAPSDPALEPVVMFIGCLGRPGPGEYQGDDPAFYVSARHPFKGPRLHVPFPVGSRVEVRAVIAAPEEDTTYPAGGHLVIGRGVLFTVPISRFTHSRLAGLSAYPHLFGIRPVAEDDLAVDLNGLGAARVELHFLNATETGR